jgi:hypothetical protein
VIFNLKGPLSPFLTTNVALKAAYPRSRAV